MPTTVMLLVSALIVGVLVGCVGIGGVLLPPALSRPSSPARGKALARLAGVKEPEVRWRLMYTEPWFDNHVSTLELRDREAYLKVEKTTPKDVEEPRLYPILERRLAREALSHQASDFWLMIPKNRHTTD